MKNNVTLFHLLIIMVILCNSCNINRNCFKSYEEYKGLSFSPNLSIVEVRQTKNVCIYEIMYTLCVGGQMKVDKGLMKINKGEISISLDTTEINFFKLFDFSLNIGDEINSIVSSESLYGSNSSLNIKLVDKFISEKKYIYLFRIFNSYCDGDRYYDQAFFVTQESGVIGSYISRYDSDNKEWIYAPRGEIFKNKIDYSEKIFGKIL